MNKDRLEECRRWAELTDKNVHIAGVRLPAGMATELVAEVASLKSRLEAVERIVLEACAIGEHMSALEILEAIRGA